MNGRDFKNIIGLKIRQIRKSRNKTQEAFCNDAGLEIPSLSNIENGKVYPSLQTIINILNVYKVQPDEFFNFIDWEAEPKSELLYNIEEYLKPLPDELKLHIYEILKNLKR